MNITIGNLIDQLSIVNIKIFMAEDIKREPDATDKKIADATRMTNVLNKQRNDIIQCIDEEINKVASGEIQKLYNQGSSKMYGKK